MTELDRAATDRGEPATDGATTAAGPRPRRRPLRWLASAAIVALAGVFLARAAGEVGWGVLRERLLAADPAALSLVLAVTLARYAVWAARWQILMVPVARVPWWPACAGLMASLFYTTVIPASRAFGGLIRANYLGRAVGRPAGPLYGAAAVDQFGYSAVSMSLGAAFLPFAFWGQPSGGSRSRFALLAAGVALLAGCLVMWRRRASLVARLGRRSPALAETVEGAIGAAGTLVARPASWAILIAGGAAVWWANVAAYQLAAAALGSTIPFAAAAAAFSLGSLAGTVTGTPGGAGTTELAALAPLVALGVPSDLALPTVLLARGMHYALSLGIGGGCALAGGRLGIGRPA